MQIFRLPAAHIKTNQIRYVIFQATSQFTLNFTSPFSVIIHIIPLKLSNWNIICFGEKEPIKVQFFRPLESLMKVHPIPHVIFETTSLGFIWILHHCSVYFCSSSLVYFGQKKTSKSNFQIFDWLGENLPNSSCHTWNHKSVFF